MAQIKKLQKGSLFPGNGTFTMGTKTLEGGIAEERILEAAKNQDPSERRFFSAAASAVRDGMDVVYDPIKYTMRVFDKDGNDVSGNYIHSRVYENDSTFKKEWDATFDNQRHRDRKSAVALSNVNMDLEELKPTLPELEGGNNRWFVYEKDDKGNWAYAHDDPTNLALEAILRNAERYTTDEEFRNQYAKTGWTQPWLKAYENAVAANQWNDVLKNIRERMVLKGKLDESDKNWLRILGIVPPAAGDGGGTGDGDDDNKKKERVPKGSGIDASYLDDDISIVKGDDGHYYIVGGDDEYWKLRHLSGESAFANSPWKAGFISDRRLYTPQEAQATTGKLGETFADWYSAASIADYGQRYRALRGTGIKFIGGDDADYTDNYYNNVKLYNTANNYSPYWHQYFSDNGVNGIGYYQPILTSDSNMHVMMIPGAYDVNNGFTSQYYYYDNNTGKVEAINEDPNTWAKNRGITLLKNTDGELVSDFESNWINKGNNQFAIAATISSNTTGDNTILIDRQNRYWLARAVKNGDSVEITKPRLIKDQENARKIVYDTNLRQELATLGNKELLARIIGKTPNEDKVTQNYYSNNYISPVPWRKSGGNIPTWKDLDSTIKKYQFGGIADKQHNRVRELDTAKASADLSNAHLVGGADGGLTNAEVTQIGAAITDLVGVGLTFAPELATNIAGGVTGIGASIARAASERQRTGKTNAGRLALDLGLDILSLIPVAGGIAKSAKAVSSITRAADPIMKALTLVGATSGAAAVAKVVSTGKMTTDDASAIIQGLASAGLHANSWKRTIGDSKLVAAAKNKGNAAAKEALTEQKVLNVQDNPTKVTKSKQEINDLIKKHNGDSKAIIKEVKQELKDSGTDITGFTDKEIEKGLKDIAGFTSKEGKFSLRHPINTFKKENRSDVWKAEKSDKDTSWKGLLFQPWKRARAFGDDWVGGSVIENRGPGYVDSYVQTLMPELAGRVRTNIGHHRNPLRGFTDIERAAIRRTQVNPEFYRATESPIYSSWWNNYFRIPARRQSYATPEVSERLLLSAPRPVITDPRFMLPMRTTRTPYLTPDVQIRYGRPEVVTPEVISAKPHIAGLLKAPYGTQFKLFKSGGKIRKGQNAATGTLKGTNVTTSGTYYNPHTAAWNIVHSTPGSFRAYEVPSPPEVQERYDALMAEFARKKAAQAAAEAAQTTAEAATKDARNIPTDASSTEIPSDNVGVRGTATRPKTRTSSQSSSTPQSGRTYDFSLPSVNNTISDKISTQVNEDVPWYKPAMTPRTEDSSINTLNAQKSTIGDYSSIPQLVEEDLKRKGIDIRTPWQRIKESLFGKPGEAGGYNGNGYEQNRAAFIDAMRANWAASDINRDAAIWKDAYNIAGTRQFYGPRLEEKAYNFSDIIHGENMSKQPYLQQDFVTPDLREQMAFNLSKASAISGIEDKYNAARSQAKAATDAYNVDVRNKQSQIDADLANQKSTYQTELAYQTRLEDSKRLNELHTKVIDPYLMQLSKDYKTIEDQRRALGYESAVAEAERTRKNKIKAKIENSNLRKQYIDDRDNPSSPWHNKSWEDWLVGNGKYEEYEKLRDDAEIQAGYLREIEEARSKYTSYPTLYRRRIVSSAEGGKIDKRSSTYDSIGRIAVNLSRESVKAIQKQKDNLAKRLLKLL